MTARATRMVSTMASAFIAAAALTGCDFFSNELEGLNGGKVSDEEFFSQIMAAKPDEATTFDPAERAGTGWLIEDPSTGKKAHIYSYDCEQDKLEAYLGAPVSALTDEYRKLLGNMCIWHNKQTSIAWRKPISYEVGGVPVFFMAHATIPTEETPTSIAFRHEEGHIISTLLGGKPEGMEIYVDEDNNSAWEEAMADAYAILTVTRDTGSLYEGAWWWQRRLFTAMPHPDPQYVFPVNTTAGYFNPFVLEAAVHKAAELLEYGAIFSHSDIELAKMARELTRENLMTVEEMQKFFRAQQSVVTYYLKRGFQDPERNPELMIKYGGYTEDNPVFRQFRRAVGFFEYLEKQPQAPSPPSGVSFHQLGPLRHNVS